MVFQGLGGPAAEEGRAAGRGPGGYPQSLKEGGTPADGPQVLLSIFKDENLSPLIGKILLEQPWTAPEGTGEICGFDNRTVPHASYYKPSRGYPIGVRYLI